MNIESKQARRGEAISPAIEEELCVVDSQDDFAGVIKEAPILPSISPVVEKDAYPIPNINCILSRLSPVPLYFRNIYERCV